MANNEDKILERIPNLIKNVRKKCPLTHCITNFVTVNDCANAVLAIGASPIMAEDTNEVEEIVNISDALLINIGTLNHLQIESMKISSKHANKTNTPITLDPVGVGISGLRNNTTIDLIKNYNMAVIRGNITEIIRSIILKVISFLNIIITQGLELRNKIVYNIFGKNLKGKVCNEKNTYRNIGNINCRVTCRLYGYRSENRKIIH